MLVTGNIEYSNLKFKFETKTLKSKKPNYISSGVAASGKWKFFLFVLENFLPKIEEKCGADNLPFWKNLKAKI